MRNSSSLRRRGAALLLVAGLVVPAAAVTTATAVGATTSVAAATAAVASAADAHERATTSAKRANAAKKKTSAKVVKTRKAAKTATSKRKAASKKYAIAKSRYVAAKKREKVAKRAAAKRRAGGASMSRAAAVRVTKSRSTVVKATTTLRKAKAVARSKTIAATKAKTAHRRAVAKANKALAAKAASTAALAKAREALARAKGSTTSTPTPAATSKPVATPKPTAAPAPKPAATAKPTSSTPPARTAYTGPATIWTAGTVIENKIISGELKVRANNVTIRNSLFVGPSKAPTRNTFMLWNTEGSTGLKVIDSTFLPTIKSPWMNGVIGAGFTLDGVTITNVIDQVTIKGDDVLIKDSTFDDNLYYAADPNHGGKESHADSVQIQQGRRITIINSTMRSANNAAVQVTQATGVVSDLTIKGNRLNHGGCTINIDDKGKLGVMKGLKILDNEFGTSQRNASCAVIRKESQVQLEATGNYFTDGRAFRLTRG